MSEIFLGEYIYKQRTARGLSQAKLCEGICSESTLSRIEHGIQEPHATTARALLERLGLPSDLYYALITKEEIELDNLQLEIDSDIIRLEELDGIKSVEKELLLQSISQKLDKFKQTILKHDTIRHQFIQEIQISLFKIQGTTLTLEEQLQFAMDTIRLTIPRFDVDHIDNFLYSRTEILLVNKIAKIYSSLESKEKGTYILGKLFNYIQTHYSIREKATGHLTLIAYNYAISLTLCERYKEAMEVIDIGRDVCLKCGHYEFLPGLIHIQAEIHAILGNQNQSLDMFHQAYYLYKALDDQSALISIQKDYFKYFNQTF